MLGVSWEVIVIIAGWAGTTIGWIVDRSFKKKELANAKEQTTFDAGFQHLDEKARMLIYDLGPRNPSESLAAIEGYGRAWMAAERKRQQVASITDSQSKLGE